jgi:hypothetical protein
MKDGAQPDEDRLIGAFHRFLQRPALTSVRAIAEFMHDARNEGTGADAVTFRSVPHMHREGKAERLESRLRDFLM